MILIAIGSNLASGPGGSPRKTCEAALDALAEAGIDIAQRSRWYLSAPEPPSDQPWFVNGVAAVETALDPGPLLAALHRIEAAFGRTRGSPNAPRTLDLDLLAYGDRVSAGEDGPVLPHPRLHERAFVLLPLSEVAPEWRHPRTGHGVSELIAILGNDQTAEPLDDEPDHS